MALRTIGTPANNTLQAIVYPYLTSAVVANDFGAINALILDDKPLLWPVGNAGTANGQNASQTAAAHPLMPTALNRGGVLHVPNRGTLKVFPGDIVAVDLRGWPILISGLSQQGDALSWVRTGNPT